MLASSIPFLPLEVAVRIILDGKEIVVTAAVPRAACNVQVRISIHRYTVGLVMVVLVSSIAPLEVTVRIVLDGEIIPIGSIVGVTRNVDVTCSIHCHVLTD